MNSETKCVFYFFQVQQMLMLYSFSGFWEEDLNAIFYQNMPNLHNWYKSAERKISQKNPEYVKLLIATPF
jgi:hypothetical protein